MCKNRLGLEAVQAGQQWSEPVLASLVIYNSTRKELSGS